MPGLLGKKIGMTSVLSADGKNVPCTGIEAVPCVVTQIKSVEKDGYAAVQVGDVYKRQALKRLQVVESFRASRGRNKPEWMIVRLSLIHISKIRFLDYFK